ncbi:MAG: class I SAM-dependent methyltransferase [Gammaproteobacteria bacterium]|nr:class I SAM-dependent methyltransferase [Gammaproteobacteria bacterium]
MNGYAVTAQFYDPMTEASHAQVRAQITDALRGLETKSYPVVDIGAGTGLTTRAIAAVMPEAEILAVEPDAFMRPALMTRIWSDPDLRRRVSILPMSILDAPLPPIIAGAVASASLVHFSPADRARLWTLLEERLLPDGRVVIEIQCPVSKEVPETLVATERIGGVRYEGWARASPLDEQRLHWHLTYVARYGDSEIDRQSTDYVCWAISSRDLLTEARAAGLDGAVSGDLVVLGKSAGET